MMRNYRILSILIALALVLSACNLPSAQPTEQVNPNAVFTAAAQTVVAQLTQSALLNPTSVSTTVAPPPANTVAPVTNTPQPLNAPTNTSAPAAAPTIGCDAAQFITDVSVPDGTQFAAGATFVKTWRLKNIGSCTWNSSYALVFDSGSSMGGAASIPLTATVAPGGSIDLSVNLQAPNTDGTYRGFWGVTNASGARIPVTGGASGRSFYVEIRVGTGTGTGTGNSTPDNCGGKACVTSVGFSISRSGATCAATKFTITATITTNKAAEITYNWVSSEAGGPTSNGSLSFDKGGSQTITVDWTPGASGKWVDLYIDKPNHQQFGRATLNCP
jgi:hypothetical protein